MNYGAMQDAFTSALGETLTTNASTDPRFFTLTEFTEWLNDYRNELNHKAKILYTENTITSGKNQRTYNLSSFSPAITQLIDVIRATYGDGANGKAPLAYTTKEALDVLFPSWEIDATSQSLYWYWETPTSIGLYPIPNSSSETITFRIWTRGYQFQTSDATSVASDFINDFQDKIALYAVIAKGMEKRGRLPEYQANWGKWKEELNYLVGRRFDTHGQVIKMAGYRDAQRKTYRATY